MLAAGLLATVAPGADALTPPAVTRTGENFRLGTESGSSRGRDVPALAVDPADPNHIVEVDEDLINGFCDYHVTFDGGKTWTGGHLTAPAGFEPQACSRFDGGDYLHLDGTVKWGSGQNVYTTFSWNRPGLTDATLVAKSTDGGRTFATAVEAIPGVPPPSDAGAEGYVRPELAVQARPEGDRIYVTTWYIHLLTVTVALGPDRRAVVTRSDDGGATWSAPVQAQRPDERARELTEPVIGPDGTVYTAWRTQATASGAPNFIVVARSTDQGQTWTHANVRQITGTRDSMPTLEVSQVTGTVFVAYEDPSTNTGVGVVPALDRDIRLQRSTDKGLTWSAPVRVNDDPVGNRVEQRIPDIAVAPNGRVDVVWHDRRNTYNGPPVPAAPVMGDTYYAPSYDDGATFAANRRITDRSYNLQIGLNGPVGTYTWYGPVVEPLGNERVMFAWQDSREGNFDNGIQDIYLARLDLGGSGQVPVRRLEGVDNATLSTSLGRLAYPGGLEQLGAVAAGRVVVVNESDGPAALAGSVLARANWAPLLASPAVGLPGAVKAEVSRMTPTGAYVLGDESALGNGVIRDLVSAGVPEDQIVRLAGPPADIARLAADAIDVRTPANKAARVPATDAAVVVNPDSPDAAAAAGLAASLRLPLLFTGRDDLPVATRASLNALAINRTLVVGTGVVVGDAVLAALPGGVRLSGNTLAGTVAAVVAEGRSRGLPTNQIFLSDPNRPVDAALAAAAAARVGGLATVSGLTDGAIAATVDALGLGSLLDRVVAVSGTGARSGSGYWLVASDGGVFSYGGAPFLGSTGAVKLNKPVVALSGTPTGSGYYLAGADGGIFAFGDATFRGSTGGLRLNKPVVGMATTPGGGGYWLVASDGGIFAFGDARFYGSTGNLSLNKPVVGMAATPTGKGYWLVAADGGIFAFGDARFLGSTGGLALNKPVVGMAQAPTGDGYLLTAADGGIFAFGDAPFAGSTGALKLNQPVVGMSATATGKGYHLVASDGGVFAFGDAAFAGSAGDLPLKQPVVGLAARRLG